MYILINTTINTSTICCCSFAVCVCVYIYISCFEECCDYDRLIDPPTERSVRERNHLRLIYNIKGSRPRLSVQGPSSDTQQKRRNGSKQVKKGERMDLYSKAGTRPHLILHAYVIIITGHHEAERLVFDMHKSFSWYCKEKQTQREIPIVRSRHVLTYHTYQGKYKCSIWLLVLGP